MTTPAGVILELSDVAKDYRGLRPLQQYRLKRFPFSIIYLEKADRVWIVAVAHPSRRPGYWGYRLGELPGAD